MKNWNTLGILARAFGVAALVVVLAVVMGSTPASARRVIDDGGDGGGGGDDGGDDGGSLSCLEQTYADFWVSPTKVKVGEYATLYWTVSPAPSCWSMTQSITHSNNGGTTEPVSRNGSKVVRVISPRTWTLVGQLGGELHGLASTSVAVEVPPTVTITPETFDKEGLFRHALTADGTRIEIQNDVQLNLSGSAYLYIAPGVKIIGGRSPTEPGPLLFTTTFPGTLFNIGSPYELLDHDVNGILDENAADEVRISGIRLQGPEMGIADKGAPAATGIRVHSSINVEIDNNELYGWSDDAVSVEDPFNRINPDNYSAVWVHDNFIHHNQRRGTQGYGVVVGNTAYALIERNVFDWNRHAIAGNGSDGSGYRAYRNLVLQNGGYHDTYNACDIPWWLALVSPEGWLLAQALCIIPGSSPSYTHYTHQFDMHGQDNCGISGTFSDAVFNCGTAGHDMDIRYNSFFYTKGNAIKLRGTPEITQQQLEPGASVISNVFAHDDLEDAVTQTETGLFLSGNLTGVNGMNELGVCDFNGDGAADDFLATGATWWYRSGALGADSPWRYLYTSFKRRNQLILGYLNGDGICDVKDDKGIVYLGGVTVLPSSIPSQSIPNVKGNTLDEAESALTDAGYARGTVSYVVDSLCNNIGLVTKQSPAAGTSMAPGTLVNLSIGKEPTICP